MCGDMDWTEVTKSRDQRWASVNTEMTFWVSQNSIFLDQTSHYYISKEDSETRDIMSHKFIRWYEIRYIYAKM
jgi:hypothetical protein